MAVTDEIKAVAGDIENHKNWRVRIRSMTPIGYAYGRGGEPRRYYSDGRGGYYYRSVTEAEMHRRK